MATNALPDAKRQNLFPNEVADNKEDIQLIWLDGNMNESDDYRLTQSMLLELNPAAQFYSDFDLCLTLIKSIKDEKIFLVVSGAFARRILSQSHSHRPLVAIFIFCATRQHHEPLMQEYNKIVGIITEQDSLLKSIREKMDLVEKQTLAFSLFDQKQKTSRDVSKETASFIWHQILIYVLRQMSQDEQSKKDMLKMCRDYYQNNKIELEKIKKFEGSCTREKAIEWYTDECFLYKLLNKALRTEDIELLYTFRFFIIDLCAAIEDESYHLKDKEILTLYRGAQIPGEELQKLKENIGKIISTNGFLSTSRNRIASLNFIHSGSASNGFEWVLFEIQVDSSVKTAKFADVANKSLIEDEEEVLFSLNSLFKIHSVHFDLTLGLWKVQLNTTDEGSEKVTEYLTSAKQEMEESSPIIYFGRLLLYDLDQTDRAGKYFNMLLQSLPPDHPDIAAVYNNIGAVHGRRHELNLALKNYETAYELRRKQLPPTHPHIAVSLDNIGSIYKQKEEFDTALDYLQKAFKIHEINYPGDHVEKAKTIHTIGTMYNDKKDFDTALIYLSRALDMYKRVLPANHPSTASCLSAMGCAHENKSNFDVALDYYYQELKMDEECLPFDHSALSSALDAIVDAYKQIYEFDKALEFCQEKLHVLKTRLGDGHPRIAQTLISMANLMEDRNLDEALQYYKEALAILEDFTPPDYLATAACLVSIACLYGKFDMAEDALQCELKALDYYRQILSSDHPNTAIILRNIGMSYKSMGNVSKALRYYKESLSIYRANYGPEHEKVKRLEADITEVTNQQLSSSPHKDDQKNVEEEFRPASDSLISPEPLPSNDLMTKSQPDNTKTKNSSTVMKSKTCLIQ